MIAADAADVLVVGAGPAGLAAAAACADVGLAVRVVADDPAASWTQTYGAWEDELATVGQVDVASHRWPDALVRTGAGAHRPLERTYCLLDNDALRASLLARAGGDVRPGRVVAVEPTASRTVVVTAAGQRHAARVVVDATGQPSTLRRPTPTRRAWQTAYGLVARFDRPPAPRGSMCLMDFDTSPFTGSGDPPTFLYAMDLGDGRWFVEETSLASRPAVPLALLRTRLHQRLDASGVTPRSVSATERCAFVMDAPVPTRGMVVAFGAAAAMVHPATGYHVAYALRRAPELAVALRDAVAADAPPPIIAETGAAAVWPPAERRRHALYRVGLEVLLQLDAASMRRFFAGFFSLPRPDWTRYVSRTATAWELQMTMTRLMGRLPADVRRSVTRATLSPPGRTWLRQAVVPPRR